MYKLTTCIISLALMLGCQPVWALLRHGTAPSAVLVCDLTTGACTGTGGGSSLFTAATCNTKNSNSALTISNGSANLSSAASLWSSGDVGKAINVGGAGSGGDKLSTTISTFTDSQHIVLAATASTTLSASTQEADWGTDDTTGLLSFQAFIATWQGSHVGQVQATIPAGKNCFNNNFGALAWASGIKNFLLSGYGATFTAGSSGWSVAGEGEQQNNTTYANVATVASGATSVTLLTTAQTSLFSVGQWVLLSGIDLQGFGYPTNPAYHDWLQIASINAGTGVIGFTTPLTSGYRQDWPNFYPGDGSSTYSGGPGTLYSMPTSWDTTTEIRGLTIVSAFGQVGGNGRSVTFRDITFPYNCSSPSQNITHTWINITASACSTEPDKLIDTLSMTNVSLFQLNFQSMSIKLWTGDNITVSNGVFGTPKNTNISHLTALQLAPGVSGYGRADEIICTSCVINGDMGPGGVNAGALTQFSMSSGAIAVPKIQNVTNAANNGSGLIRLTVDTSAAWTTGRTATIFNISAGTTEANGTWTLTVIDGTHVDLQGSTFTHAWVGGQVGEMGIGAVRFAVPGTNLLWTGNTGTTPGGTAKGAFQVTAVTFDSINTYVQTTLAGGFPTGATGLIVHPAPKFTCSGCTGSPQALGYSGTPAGDPLYSYHSVTFNSATVGTTPQPLFNSWGYPTQLNFNVTAAAGSALTFDGRTIPEVQADDSTVFYQPHVNANLVGNRQITPSGVTCVSGTCTGDSGLAIVTSPTTAWFTGVQGGGQEFSAATSGAIVTQTFRTNQGVVNP